MTPRILLTSVFVVLITQITTAQSSFTQTIRGNVADKISNSPLPGAIVVVQGTDPVIGASTDMDGNFKLTNVPIGKQNLIVNFVGYKAAYLAGITVNSGKEVVLNILLDEEINQMSEVVISAKGEDNSTALNTMTSVSARTFSVEETQKFAAAVNDPGRMVSAFAGVVSADDGGNSISIRGNSPTGLLWRMEGLEIPNPNHYASAGASGGGISILSAQLLGNSDFMTGAFAAEYGNALSGVFDLKLRKGNNEKREFTLQAGVLGLDAAVEGPLSRNNRGSYLFNYRYSTLNLLDNMGINVGSNTNFQDLSFHIFLPTEKLGTFSLFGFGGLSGQFQKAERDSLVWEDEFMRYDAVFYSNTGMAGLKHVISLGANTYLQSGVTMSAHQMGFEIERLDDSYAPKFAYNENYLNRKIQITSLINHKFNARHSVRAGFYQSVFLFNLHHKYDEDGTIVTPLNASGSTSLNQSFAQWKYRMTDDLTMNAGAHVMYAPESKNISVEPRLGMRYVLNPVNTISLGYGIHSQMQGMGVISAQINNSDGTVSHPNKNIGFSRAHHFVAGYERNLTELIYLKTEVYYQSLFDIPVKNEPGSSYSLVNIRDGYITDALVNDGVGRNYGLELTVEQKTHKGLYFLLSASLYDSEYKAKDGIWRDTRYNGSYATAFTAGKEWKVGKNEKNNTIGLNLRITHAGGFRETPIDLQASIENGETRYIESEAFSLKNTDYFRTDIRVSYKKNRPKATSTLALDLMNATNHKNIYGKDFDPLKGTVVTYYQVPLIPVLSYRIEF